MVDLPGQWIEIDRIEPAHTCRICGDELGSETDYSHHLETVHNLRP